jgi:ABC-2 type transport system ATP-binding protein
MSGDGASAGAPLLRARDLTCAFDGRVALESLDLEVPRGWCVALVGHNGSGKSTAVRCLGGQQAPTRGEVRIGGFDAATAGADVARLRSVVPDEGVDALDLTVRERVEHVASEHGLGDRAPSAAAGILEQLGLHSRREAHAHQLSLGLHQRAQLACGLVRPFELLILDEPTRYLDVVATEQVVDRLVAELDRGCGLVLTSHDPELVRALADEALVLEEGRTVARGTPDDVLVSDAAVRAGLT